MHSMNFQRAVILSFYLFLMPVFAHAEEYAVQPYNAEVKLQCGAEIIHVPPLQFADMSSVWLMAPLNNCGVDTAQIYYALDKACQGQHVCTAASFSYSNISAVAKKAFLASMRQDAKNIELVKHIEAYIIPSECGAYCAPLQLMWFEGGKLYNLSSKGDAKKAVHVQELIDAANTYIGYSVNAEQE